MTAYSGNDYFNFLYLLITLSLFSSFFLSSFSLSLFSSLNFFVGGGAAAPLAPPAYAPDEEYSVKSRDTANTHHMAPLGLNFRDV